MRFVPRPSDSSLIGPCLKSASPFPREIPPRAPWRKGEPPWERHVPHRRQGGGAAPGNGDGGMLRYALGKKSEEKENKGCEQHDNEGREGISQPEAGVSGKAHPSAPPRWAAKRSNPLYCLPVKARRGSAPAKRRPLTNGSERPSGKLRQRCRPATDDALNRGLGERKRPGLACFNPSAPAYPRRYPPAEVKRDQLPQGPPPSPPRIGPGAARSLGAGPRHRRQMELYIPPVSWGPDLKCKRACGEIRAADMGGN
ncbi:hypothetical protein SKAU_G00202920 [Synaphobranchus kaupii]|uniref:Uncharacterized protein n=1 Tax=Synaphobranchus kaupii TaxID=118154 RepID=A0A9Q1FFU8_SYNKA|nr:hypothetical protein SKAU_G00202920 [Synaphobranchus kaupii]